MSRSAAASPFPRPTPPRREDKRHGHEPRDSPQVLHRPEARVANEAVPWTEPQTTQNRVELNEAAADAGFNFARREALCPPEGQQEKATLDGA